MNNIIRTRSLTGLMVVLFCMTASLESPAGDAEVTVPVSINALMVTLIDHSAHYIWDYGNLEGERELTDKEWQIVEYYAIQLAASGPLITLGGSGELDMGWSADPGWIKFAKALSNDAMAALAASQAKDHRALFSAGSQLVQTCVACHDAFKPEVPTEGIMHNPEYDHLYHLLSPDEE